MWADLKVALVIARREVIDQLRDWRIIFPVLGLTIFFPFLMNFTARQALDFVSQYGASIIAERMIPFLLMIVGFFPISVSLVIALESFVGEKERLSIEPLLNSPLKDWQLYLGKLLSSTVPSLLASFLGMGVYIAGLAFQHMTLPEPLLLLQIYILTVIQAIVMVSGAVVVSSQATSVRAANLLASFIIIPIALLIQAESLVMFWGNFMTLWLIVFGMLALAILLVRVGLAHFQREELLGREIDVLNVRWSWKVFLNAFRGGAKSIPAWYRVVLPATLRRLGQPSAAMVVLILIALFVGSQVGTAVPNRLLAEGSGSVNASLQKLVTVWPLFSFGPVLSIWWQNVRVLGLGILLGVFSFGVLGVMPIMATFSLMGFLAHLIAASGASLGLYFLGFILPHGIFEIPAIILSGAAVLQMGAILATPTPGKTVGEVWLACLADWFKVMIGLVLPLLFAAAMIEAWLTPRIALLLIH